MPLDESTHRLAFLFERDLRRVRERSRARAERGESISYDPGSRIGVWESRRGEVLGRWFAEVLATYVVKDRILRWAWAGRASDAMPSHVDVVAREGQIRGGAQLTMSVVGDLAEEDARVLAELGLILARGDSLEVRRGEHEIELVGLFEQARPRTAGPAKYSVPPPRAASVPPPRAASVPPPRGASVPPSPEPSVREPSRALFVPVATALLAAITRHAAGFQQALGIVTIDAEGARPVVTVAAIDAGGVLRALEPTAELAAAVAVLVEKDRAEGNGRWRKLAARVLPKTDGGATLHVDVL